jgi:hypothetical protein
MPKASKKTISQAKKAAMEAGTLGERKQKKLHHNTGVKAARRSGLVGQKRKTWTENAEVILRRMHSHRGVHGMRFVLDNGMLCRLGKRVSGFYIDGAFRGRDLMPGETVMIVSDPIDSMGDGLRVDILAGADVYGGVKLKTLRPLRDCHED